MKVQIEDFPITPDEELAEIYRTAKKRRRLVSLSMLYMAYLVMGTSIEMFSWVLMVAAPQLDVILRACSLILGLVGTSLVFIDSSRMHIIMTWVFCFLQIVILILNMFLCRFSAHEVGIICENVGIVAIVNLIAHQFIVPLEALRQHPHYPFSEWRRSEQYLSGRNNETALKLVENAMNKGKVVAVSHEDVFEGEAKAFEPPKPDPELNLQQRKQVWRDESDKTAYTLDNIHRMYFDDGKEYGELSGKDLEKQLMKATAPTKPPEPLPEEFFQQQTIIWRNKNDGVGSLPPEKKEGDDHDRTVLP